MALAVLTGVTLARCQSSSITGPAEPSATAPASGGEVRSLLSSGPSEPKQALAVFPTQLLPTYHPCYPDLTFVDMSGQSNWTYTDEWATDANGTRVHTVRWKPQTDQKGSDNYGRSFKGASHECGNGADGVDENGNCFAKFPGAEGNRKHTTVHFNMQTDADPQKETCTTQIGAGSSGPHSGGNDCNPEPFASDVTVDMLLVEDPVTNAGTLTLTTLSIASTCPSLTAMAGSTPTLAMADSRY